ncbi:hypothetical protein D3C76_1617100 [compost metagenome]
MVSFTPIANSVSLSPLGPEAKSNSFICSLPFIFREVIALSLMTNVAPSSAIRLLNHIKEIFSPSGNVGLGFLRTVSIPETFKVP